MLTDIWIHKLAISLWQSKIESEKNYPMGMTGGHTWCQENVGIVRETGIVLVAMNSDLLMVGLMKSVSGTHRSLMKLTMTIARTPEMLTKTSGPWPA